MTNANLGRPGRARIALGALLLIVGVGPFAGRHPLQAQLAPGGAAGCAGDCGRDGAVTVDELVMMVNVALGDTTMRCLAGDSDRNDSITVDEIVTAVGSALDGCPADPRPACDTGRQVDISPSDQDQDNLLLALIDARPCDVITLAAGTYHLTGQLSLDVDDVTVRGAGMDKTILSFRTQTTGAEGLLVSGNRFVIEDLALEDSPGDLLKVIGANGLTIRRTRAEWTNGPDEHNGSYGFYPVECRNVLIEDSIARGASDTGFYVGQSDNIILRRNRAELNVSGIEIEDSTDADVYENTATHNTGGILVFNLPGLAYIDGRRTRVFTNQVLENNTQNFAPRGTTVSAVPTGTGLMILANDQVEVFGNTFRDNDTTDVLIISFQTAALVGGFRTNDRSYDFYSEDVYLHDNQYIGGGTHPEATTAQLLQAIIGNPPLPQILYDGYENPQKQVNGQLPDNLRICIQETAPTFWNVDLRNLGATATNDISRFNCAHPHLPPVTVAGVDALPTPTPAATPSPTPSSSTGAAETRCVVPPGSGVNFDPADSACDLLSSYRFFRHTAALLQPNDGVTPYDLNTPLFSDYANKHRLVWLPAGTSAQYRASDSFDFPVGTVIIKTFAYPSDLGDPTAAERLLETRLLVHREHGWVGLPYVWNAQQTEAQLKVLGTTIPVSALDEAGIPFDVEYHVPNVNQCKECHNEHNGIMGPLGPKARNLNKSYAYAAGSENQLAHWTRLGLVTGAPDPTAAPRNAVFDDPTTGTLAQRARSYLDVNCGNCHNPSGAARTTGLYLTIGETDPTHLGTCKSPVAAGTGTGGFSFDINPGHPESSILVFRMASTEPGIAMPELGRQLVHAEAVQLIRDWIASLPDQCQAPR